MSKVSDFFKTLFTGFGEKAKLGLSLAFLFLLVLMFAFGVLVKGCAEAQAVTYHCDASSVTLNVTETGEGTDCPDCPPPPECPPTLACEDGYSCQQDTVEPPDGEQQQYPPADAELWVQSITGTNLIDVMLDDPRWGNREEGEVYARENDDFITWYWPAGGEATFDPTRLGDTAAWYDYRIDTGDTGGGESTSVALSAGMTILFTDSNGGVSIFQRKATPVDPPPVVGQCSTFLRKYTNASQGQLPAHRVYPMGQKMMITAWGAENTYIDDLAAAGFTMGGPNWNPDNGNFERDADLSKQYGLRMAYRITNGASTASELLAKMDNGAQEDQMFAIARGKLNRALNYPNGNEIIDIWLTGTEELSTRAPSAADKEKTYRYLRKMKALVQELDPQKRPLWMSDVTGVSQSQMMPTHRYLDMVGPQNYLDRCCVDGGYASDAQAGAAARKIASTAKALDSQYPQARPHAATMSHGLHYTPLSQERIDNMDRIIPYWVFTAFNEGLQGMQIYSWYNQYTSISAEARANGKAAYKAAVKLLTDQGLDQVYLWGQHKQDLSLAITDGPSKTAGYDSISMSNIQYGDDRYITITNASESDVTIRLSGFPNDCQKIKNLKTGQESNLGTSVTATLGFLDVLLYKVSR